MEGSCDVEKRRVVAVLALGRGAGSRRWSWQVAPAAKPAERARRRVKLGFITKFPVDFFFVLENAAKKWDKAHKDATVIFAQGKSATDDAGEIARSRTWSRRA